jgi:PTS system N-acetylglucosamine-specific IIC component
MALLDVLHVKLGFTFSAGLFDYVLNFGKATRPLWLIPIGLVYAGLYYGLFRLAIARFDLKTPGREDDEVEPPQAVTTGGGRGADFVQALGGAANLQTVDACTTRLRLIVADQAQVNEPALKALGARGIVKPSDKALQVVLGPIADTVAGEIRAALGSAPKVQPAQPAQPAPAKSAPTAQDNAKAQAILAALGGPANLREVSANASRLRLVLANPASLDPTALAKAGARGCVTLNGAVTHIVIGPKAERVAEFLRRAIGAPDA